MTTSKPFNEDEYRRERVVQGRDDYRQARKEEFSALAEIVSKYARAAASLVFAATAAATDAERFELTSMADDALQRATRFQALLAEVELTDDDTRWVVESSSYHRSSDTHSVTCIPASQAELGVDDVR